MNTLGAAARGCLPPDQLLRRAFEICDGYAAARRFLEKTPVARPVIYTLVGCAAGERCMIERTETDFVTREKDTCAANDWVPCRPGWEGRIGTRRFLVCSFAEAAKLQSGAARSAGQLERPVIGSPVRLDARAGAQPLYAAWRRDVSAHGVLRAVGYDIADGNLPVPVTQMCDIESVVQAVFA